MRGAKWFDQESANSTTSAFGRSESEAGDDALAGHGKGAGMKAAMGAVGGLLAGRPEVIMMSPVAAKGLDI